MGFRNAQVTVLAPTGTIGFMMDCDTTGIEPDIALVKYKLLAGGGMFKIVNRTVPLALERLGYSRQQIGRDHRAHRRERHDRRRPDLKDEHLPVFDCAVQARQRASGSIHYMGHIRMMAAVQPFLSGAISKTVNMPKESTVEEIMQVYIERLEAGPQGGGDLSRRLQADAAAERRARSRRRAKAGRSGRRRRAPRRPRRCPHRRRLPATRPSITHKFEVAGHEGYLNVGLYEDGTPGEVFITMAKEGSTVGGMMDAFATAISLCLQYGVPLEALVKKFTHQRFEPSGMTNNRGHPLRQEHRGLRLPLAGPDVPGGVPANRICRNGTRPRRPPAAELMTKLSRGGGQG